MEVISLVVVIVLLILSVIGVRIYNNLVALKHSVSKAWVNLEVLLKQRHDELNKLTELYNEFEIEDRDLFKRLRESRTEVMNTQQLGEVQSLSLAEAKLRTDIQAVLELGERNEELAKDSRFQRMMSVFKEFDRAISDRQEEYNQRVAINNDSVHQFPISLVANFFSFGEYEKLSFSSHFEQRAHSAE